MWFGADPGGKDAYGVARLYEDGTFETEIVSNTDQALGWVGSRPLAVGIDSPMWWSSGQSGDRSADKFLRETYKIAAGTVQTANSLRGAALIQGHMLAVRLRETFPDVPITEAHPKALLLALKLRNWSDIAGKFGLVGFEPSAQHARDAVLSAVAAREGVSGGWSKNLAEERLPSEQDPLHLAYGSVAYFWPGDLKRS